MDHTFVIKQRGHKFCKGDTVRIVDSSLTMSSKDLGKEVKVISVLPDWIIEVRLNGRIEANHQSLFELVKKGKRKVKETKMRFTRFD